MRTFGRRAAASVLMKYLDLDKPKAHAVLDRLLVAMEDALASGRAVEFRNFGVLKPTMRKARTGRNPKRPDDVYRIPAQLRVRFIPGKSLKERLKR